MVTVSLLETNNYLPCSPQVPRDPADLKKNIYLCRGCNEYQSSTDFALKTNASAVGLCRRCMDLDNEARRREDFSLYKNILMCLQESEAECSPEAKITYLLQVTIIHFKRMERAIHVSFLKTCLFPSLVTHHMKLFYIN